MDSTSPSGLDLELGGACDDSAPSPDISETLSVVNGGVNGRVSSQTNGTSDMHTSTANCGTNSEANSNGTQGMIAPMFGVTSVTEFLNSVSKSEASFNATVPIVSSIPTTSQQTQQQNSNITFCRLGRRVGDVHRHFSYVIREGKEYGVCVYCGHTLQRNTTRQKHHLSTHCPNAPLEVKTRYDQERNSIHTRPAIEFQRKRSLDLPPGSMSGNMYPNDMEGSMPISAMDIPVKVERIEERLDPSTSSIVKTDKTVLRMSELEDEDDPNLPPVPMPACHLPPTIFNPSVRREVEASSITESRFRKPLKLWDHSRRVKKGIVVSSLRELIVRGCTKLNISSNESVRPVLEEDGTEVDDEEYLEYLPDNATILLLRSGEEWKPPGPYDDAIVRARHMRHREIYRGVSERRDL